LEECPPEELQLEELQLEALQPEESIRVARFILVTML